MKIYIVIEQYWSETSIIEVFASEEKAKACAEERNKKADEYYHNYVEDWEVTA